MVDDIWHSTEMTTRKRRQNTATWAAQGSIRHPETNSLHLKNLGVEIDFPCKHGIFLGAIMLVFFWGGVWCYEVEYDEKQAK